MTLLLDAVIKVSVILSCAVAAATMARKRSAAFRHAILSAAVVAALAAPFAALLLPSWHLGTGQASFVAPLELVSAPGDAAASGTTPIAAARSSASDTAAVVIRRLVVPIWLAGVVWTLLVLISGLARLVWLAATSERMFAPSWTGALGDIALEYGVFRPVRLLHSEHPTLLVTWGLRTPTIVLPRAAAAWPPERIRVVLCHELAHIRRADWIPQLTAEVLRTIYWFNPLVWIACRRLRAESEYACDDRVLRAGIEASAYATELLDLARAAVTQRGGWSPALAIARPSSLEGRIHAMLTVHRDRKPLTGFAGALIAAGCVAIAVPVAGFATAVPPADVRGVRLQADQVTRTRDAAVPPAVNVIRRSVLDRRRPGTALDPTAGVVAGETLTQVAFASFSGVLVDQSGGLLPGVTLSLVNKQTLAKQEVHSGHTGRFEFIGLPAGDYAYDASLPGFRSIHEDLTFAAGHAAEQNLTLQIGSISETIKVTDGESYPPDYGTQLSARKRDPAAAPACSAPVAGAIGGNIKAPAKVSNTLPIYPAAAKDAKVQGVVILEGRIDTYGAVEDVRVLRSIPQLDGAAVDAVRQWRFDPTRLNCAPIDTSMTVTISFELAR